MMKAEITKDGCLVISAENGIEGFALNQWHINYFETKDDERFATLMINTALPQEIN